MLKIAILGASGYTGLELLRILANHPSAEVVKATSRQYKGQGIGAAFPFLKGYYGNLCFSDPAQYKSTRADVVFCALPHGASQEVVPEILDSSAKVIDLSADFRLTDENTYTEWYGVHKAPELLEKAVYGLPELNR
ncbi:N-acetyl-gamma-glutamyl-phosphate reductase, partial [bacterium]